MSEEMEVERGEVVPGGLSLPGRWGLYAMQGEQVESVDEPEVDLSTLTFDELVKFANDHHGMVGQAADEALASLSRGLKHAIRVGEALLLIRAQVPAGTWTRWQAENLTFGSKSATRYMRFATYKDELLGASEPLNSNTASDYLRGLPAMENLSYRAKNQDLQAEASRLHKEGVSVREIGQLLGKDTQTVRRWVDPAYRRECIRAQSEKVKAARAARAALAEQERRAERDRLAKTGTENQQEIYRLIRRAAKLADIEGGLADVVRPLMKAEEQILAAIDRSEHGS